MKPEMYLAFMAFAALSFFKSNAQSSNRTLSNLNSPTAINQSLLPDVDAATNPDNAKDLGSLGKSWQNLFINGRLYLNDSITIHARGAGNFFSGISAGNTSLTGQYNTGIGSNALHTLASGFYNTALGYNSLYKNTSGSYNKASGYYALYANTTGRDNTADGYLSLYNNTNGSYNTGSGSWALYSNNSGNNNVAYGYSALWQNKTGNDNTAIGKYAMYSNVTGYSNVASGDMALFSNTKGYSNVAIGTHALYSSTRTNNLVAIGDSALYHFTGDLYTNDGYNIAVGSKALYNAISGNDNIAIGRTAMYNTTTGAANVAVGLSALYANTAGVFNTAIGRTAVSRNTTGDHNTGVGFSCLDINETGSYNTALGSYSGPNSFGSISNSTAIGYITRTTASNQVRLGNEAVTSIGGQVGWTIFSDGRYKRNIKENVSGLAFINSLRPITYTVDTKSLNEYYNRSKKQADEKGKESMDAKAKVDMDNATDEASRVVYDGFVAQEVEAAAKKLQFEFSGVDKPRTEDGLYGLRYDNFVVPLVKAVQELSKQNEDLQKQITELHEILLTGDHKNAAPTIKLSSASLEQNTPNPFAQSTTIHYTLPQRFTTAQIVITDNNGKTIKQAPISSGTDNGILHVDALQLSPGIYNYSLMIDGRIIETKKMILTK